MSPDSHSDFTQVTWVQMTQFNQVAMMYALSKGQLGNKTIYLDLNNNAKHDEFWISELESVQSYVTELTLHNGVYTQYNPFIYQELAYLNAPLKQTPYLNWNKETCPTAIEFPYSNLTIYWDDVNDEWYFDNVPAEQSPAIDENPCSKCLGHITCPLHKQNAFCHPDKSYSNGNLALSTPDESFPKNTCKIVENYIQ